MSYNILKPNVPHTFDFNIQSRFSLTQFTDCIFRTSLTSMCSDIDINYLQPLTHVWQKMGGRCNLTTTTKFKLFSGLTHSAVKRPSFPSAKRYAQGVKKLTK